MSTDIILQIPTMQIWLWDICLGVYKDNRLGGDLLVVTLEKSMKAYRAELCVKLLVEGEVMKKTDPIALLQFHPNWYLSRLYDSQSQ